ncbi:WxL protein peptidoglycan domain-containing protein [Actinacidiphila glaucinigra]|uniref:WxL protein peptidoglycan domain-containing protein n=1 Tax=Actinacidiphila glaucinigra TaxID=235986 RepID=UPI0037CCA910
MTRRSATPISPRHIVAALVAALAVLLGTLAHATPAPTNRPANDDQISWGAAPADTSAGKGRSHFTYTLAPGSRVTDALAVVNRSDTTIKLKVYASDAFTTPGGGIDLLTADKSPVTSGRGSP